MRIIIFFLSFIICGWTHGQVANEKTIFLDGNDKQVTEEAFNKIQMEFIAINDSLNIHKAVTNRKESGKLSNYNKIKEYLSKIVKLDSTKYLVIIFHPGKDEFNSGGSQDLSFIKKKNDDLKQMIAKKGDAELIYIYKSPNGLEKQKTIIDWHQDPDKIIEHTFFKFHYPGSSYTVISPDGSYSSYFGEFSKDFVINTLTEIKKKKKIK